MWRLLFLVLAVSACSSKAPAPEEPAEPAAEVAEQPATEPQEEVAADQAADGPALKSPSALYEECRDRVEGPSSEGECETDADCAPAGCSKEVCVPAARGADIMTTCEVKPCYRILDTCGCVEGTCSWSIKDETPPLGSGKVIALPGDGDGAEEPE